LASELLSALAYKSLNPTSTGSTLLRQQASSLCAAGSVNVITVGVLQF